MGGSKKLMPIYESDMTRIVPPEVESDNRKALKNVIWIECDNNLSDIEVLVLRKRLKGEIFDKISADLYLDISKVRRIYKKAIKKCKVRHKAAQGVK